MHTTALHCSKESVTQYCCQGACGLYDLKYLVEAVSESALLMSPEGKLISLNNIAAIRLGATPEELTGKNVLDMLPPAVAQRRKQKIATAFARKRMQTFEDQREGVSFRNTIVPIFTREGERHAVAIFAMDISREREFEQKASTSAHHLTTVLENICEAVILTDTTGDIKYFSPSATNIFSVLASKHADSRYNIFSLLPALRNQTFNSTLNCAALTNNICTMPKPHHCSITLSVSAKYTSSDRDEILFVCTDISSVKKVEDELRNKNIALHEIIEHVTAEKKVVGENISENLQRLVFPIIEMIAEKPDCSHLAKLLKSTITHITSEFTSNSKVLQFDLSPRELQICTMINEGMTVKQIAHILNTSPYTVETQRKVIRKKLGISDGKTNLVSFLKKEFS